MQILQVDHLKKYFATQKAVDDISFDVDQGSIFGLLGPNGAGKTTLIRMITGIFYPDEGTITLNGKKFDPINDVIHLGYMLKMIVAPFCANLNISSLIRLLFTGSSPLNGSSRMISFGSCKTVVTNCSF